MHRKFRKLWNNPNRFFFDFFAKRLGATTVNGAQSARHVMGSEDGAYLLPQGFTFDPEVHPWLQVAQMFKLKSGALSGQCDQSMLVDVVDLFDLFTYVLWIAHANKCDVRVYSLGGGAQINLKRRDLLSTKTVESLFSKMARRSDFVIELLGEFVNNFSAHFFVYDVGLDQITTVRSGRAFVKKFKTSLMGEIYPDVKMQESAYAFDTKWPVDVVYTWVNKDDPDWVALWNNAFPDMPFDNDRFKSKDELKYSIRAICKYLPWYRKIFIVSNCAKPTWMNDSPQLEWVTHAQIFPDAKMLPTFNSHAIEACLHRIPGLSEKFIYFNDDVFVMAPSYPDDYIDNIGRTVAQLEPYGMVYGQHPLDASTDYLAAATNSRGLLKANLNGTAAHRLHKHTPHSLNKSTLERIEKTFRKDIELTRAAKLRSAEDVNLASFLYHHYAFGAGELVEGHQPSALVRPTNIKSIIRAYYPGKYKFMCFNDGGGSADNNSYEQGFVNFVTQTFPHKSHFEN